MEGTISRLEIGYMEQETKIAKLWNKVLKIGHQLEIKNKQFEHTLQSFEMIYRIMTYFD